MMTKRSNDPLSKEISKLLSLLLRHDPDKLGVALDANGWTSIDELVFKIRASGLSEFDRAMLNSIVENSDKKRFTVSEGGDMIRAAQGHSVVVDLALQSSQPPFVLYHGTALSNLPSIREQGLLPGRRQQVHLSIEYAAAKKVGERHGRPVVLKVDTVGMTASGMQFFKADNGVWLTDNVPSRYLVF